MYGTFMCVFTSGCASCVVCVCLYVYVGGGSAHALV